MRHLFDREVVDRLDRPVAHSRKVTSGEIEGLLKLDVAEFSDPATRPWTSVRSSAKRSMAVDSQSVGWLGDVIMLAEQVAVGRR